MGKIYRVLLFFCRLKLKTIFQNLKCKVSLLGNRSDRKAVRHQKKSKLLHSSPRFQQQQYLMCLYINYFQFHASTEKTLLVHSSATTYSKEQRRKKLLNLKLTIMLIRAIAIDDVDQPSGMEFSNALKTKEPDRSQGRRTVNLWWTFILWAEWFPTIKHRVSATLNDAAEIYDCR